MQIANTNNQLRITRGSDIEFYSFSSMKSVSWRQDKDLNYYLVITFNIDTGDTPLEIKLSDVTSPGGWANTTAGIQSAIGDISTWMTATTSSSLLSSILSSLQAGREFESRLVKDNAGVLWNEIRFMDTDTGAFTVQHLDASGTAGSPSLPVTFVDSTATLASILAKNTEIEVTADDILAKNTQIGASSSAIETNTTGILADTAAIDTATAAINTNTATLGVATNTAFMVRGTGSVTVTDSVKSISAYNAGGGTGTITIGLSAAADLLAGETVNFDAGGNGNKFPGSHFVINGAGVADILIIYTY